MNVVLRLVPRDNADTVSVLESLLNEARRQEITDVCLTYRRRNGTEDVAFSGLYRHHPVHALHAAIQMQAALIRIE